MLAVMCLTGLFIQGCDKIKLEKTVDGGEITFTLDPQAKGDFDLRGSKKINLAQMAKDFGLDASDISSIKMRVKAFYIIDSSANFVTFDYLDKASFSIGEPGVQIQIAHKDPMPTGKSQGPCEADTDPDTDVINFANQETTEFHLKGTLNTAVDHQVKIKATVEYDIKAMKK